MPRPRPSPAAEVVDRIADTRREMARLSMDIEGRCAVHHLPSPARFLERVEELQRGRPREGMSGLIGRRT